MPGRIHRLSDTPKGAFDRVHHPPHAEPELGWRVPTFSGHISLPQNRVVGLFPQVEVGSISVGSGW